MRVVALLLLTSCFHTNDAATDAGATSDDGPSANIDAPAGSYCFGTQQIDMGCLPAKPTGMMQKAGTINTGNDAACAKIAINGVDTCVLAADTFEIMNGVLRVGGSKPLVIVAATSISLTGATSLLDTGGHDQTAGAASLATLAPECTANSIAPVNGGGGWGGAGHGLGGNGGNELDNSDNMIGARGKAASALTLPAKLRGGCTGGGTVASAQNGGGGGGVVVLIAPAVHIEGTISASGGAGHGGNHHGGDGGAGGGGGAGGMIVIDSPAIDGSGRVLAQGGGGGQGGDAKDLFDGAPGTDGLAAINAGNGGRNLAMGGGDGGNGATSAVLDGQAGNNSTDNAGGGGGGGAAGFNLVFVGTPGTLQLSPAPN